MKTLRAAITVSLVVLATLPLTGCTDPPPPVSRLVIATGAPGGVYHRLGDALAAAARDEWQIPVNVLETPASAENLRLVMSGKADVAFATVDTVKLLQHGEPPFDHPGEVAALAWLYDDYLQIVVRSDRSPPQPQPGRGDQTTRATGPTSTSGPPATSGLPTIAPGGTTAVPRIATVKDLAGRRVSTGAPGSGTEIVTERVLRAAGLNIGTDIVRHRLGPRDSADALRAGTIDAFIFTGGLPTPAVADLAGDTGIRLLTLGSEQSALLATYGDMYSARTIATSVYQLPEQVNTIGIPNVLVVRADMPEETARRLTELLFDAKPQLVAAHVEARRLDPRAALSTYPVPLHPGAARYYRDTKIMAAAP